MRPCIQAEKGPAGAGPFFVRRAGRARAFRPDLLQRGGPPLFLHLPRSRTRSCSVFIFLSLFSAAPLQFIHLMTLLSVFSLQQRRFGTKATFISA